MVDFPDDDLEEEFPLGDGTADTDGSSSAPIAASRMKSASTRAADPTRITWRIARSAAGPGA